MSRVTGPAEPKPSDKTAYDFSFETLDGRPLPLAQFRGKAMLVVNTASQCGFTPQYRGLEALYRQYEHAGFVIIGVPSNDFGAQEPGTAQEIAAFCEKNYGVTFPMTAKYTVTGERAHPFYRWLASVFGGAGAPKWNFHKFLIDTHGHAVTYFGSATAPDNSELRTAIEKQLPAHPG